MDGGNEFEAGQIARRYLLYFPRDNVPLGTEFGWGQREDIDGNTGSGYRQQFSQKVSFNFADLMTPRPGEVAG